MPSPDPLILTLRMDETAFARFDGLRRRHFPEALNRIPAHATLFHHLPGDAEAEVVRTVRDLTAAMPAPEVTVASPRFTGRGVAYPLESRPLADLRVGLARAFADWLTPQDRQGWRPHVTVQNKVDPGTARALQADLAHGFAPFRFTATGLLLWRYLGGPWEARGTLPFEGTR